MYTFIRDRCRHCVAVILRRIGIWLRQTKFQVDEVCIWAIGARAALAEAATKRAAIFIVNDVKIFEVETNGKRAKKMCLTVRQIACLNITENGKSVANSRTSRFDTGKPKIIGRIVGGSVVVTDRSRISQSYLAGT